MTRTLAFAALAALAGTAPARAQSAPPAGYQTGASTGPATMGYPGSSDGLRPKPPAKPSAKPAKAAAELKPKKQAADQKKTASVKRGKYEGPCSADARRLCPQARGRQETHACLRRHLDGVSDRCRAASTRSIDAACGNERGLLCSGLPSGSDKLMRCLIGHERDATTECANALDDAAPGGSGGARP